MSCWDPIVDGGEVLKRQVDAACLVASRACVYSRLGHLQWGFNLVQFCTACASESGTPNGTAYEALLQVATPSCVRQYSIPNIPSHPILWHLNLLLAIPLARVAEKSMICRACRARQGQGGSKTVQCATSENPETVARAVDLVSKSVCFSFTHTHECRSSPRLQISRPGLLPAARVCSQYSRYGMQGPRLEARRGHRSPPYGPVWARL